MSTNRTYISKEYINKEEVIKTIEAIAIKQGFRVEKENVYIEGKDIDIIIDPENEEDDLVYRSSMRIKSLDNFNTSKINHNKHEYYIYIYTSETFDDNQPYQYFNHFVREFLQVYPQILVDSGGGENFVSIHDILSQNEKVPSWMLKY
jgi:hypothetical protein